MENIVNLNCKLSVFLLILFGIFACNFSYDKWSEFDAGGNTQQYDTYYISANGRDKSMCGKTEYSACKSLNYVLGIYYKDNQVPQLGLSIITSKSLTINQQLTFDHPKLVRSKVIISASESTNNASTIFLNGLNFLNSYWILSNVNLEMINCHASSLALELKDLTDVIIQNCTFGDWTFRQVQNIFIENITNVFKEGVPTSLNFYNSSAFIKNMTIENENLNGPLEGISVQDFSIFFIEQSSFMYNTVNYGLIKVLNLSNLIMSNCTVFAAAAIFANASHINITNSYLENNHANLAGGAIFAQTSSRLQIEKCTFRNNKANISGGAIHLAWFSEAHLFDVYFSRNRATLGGAIYLGNYSTLNANYLNASQNTASFGGVTSALVSCNVSCDNCFLSENIAEHRLGVAIQILNNSMLIMSNVRCVRQKGNLYSCIYAQLDCTVSVNNCTFDMNNGSALFIGKNSYLIVLNSQFVNNVSPKDGAAILSLKNNLIEVFYSIFDHNEAHQGGAIYQENSETKLNECSFFWNSDSAVVGLGNNEVSIENCHFESNVGKNFGGAVSIVTHGVLNISQTTFKNNIQNLISYSLNKTLDRNATEGGGAVLLFQSVGKISKSGFYNNYASSMGGAVCLFNSSLSVSDTTFENNAAVIFGGAIYINNSFVNAEYSTFKNNSVFNKTIGWGGGLYLYGNSTVKTSNVLFSECHASFGGAIASNFSQIIMASTSLIANTGSAIYLVEEDSVDINNCTFANNSTPDGGGAISCLIYCDVKMVNSHFIRNRAVVGGGAVCVITIKKKSKLLSHNCSFTHNTAYTGGAISISNSHCSILDSNCSDNIATEGGVIVLLGNDVGVITNCHISNNNATGVGGVIKALRGTLEMSECQVFNNTANSYGGVGVLIGSTVVIINCTFKMNLVLGMGGVFFAQNATTLLRNSSFVNNIAELSGGVFFLEHHSVINLTDSRCFGNQAKQSGGVLYSRLDTKVLISDTEISQNSGLKSSALWIDGNSVLELNGSRVVNNNARDTIGVLSVLHDSLLIAFNSSFKGNKAYRHSSLYISNSTAYLEKCTFMENFQTSDGGTIYINAAVLRIAHTIFAHNTGYDIYSETQGHFINRLDTYRCLFKHDNFSLKSNMNHFKQIAVRENIISNISFPFQVHTAVQETPYASILPQPCLHNGTCYSSPWQRTSILDCRNKELISLPATVLPDTDWLLLSGSNLGSLNEAPDYLNNITLLDVRSSNITEIKEAAVELIMHNVKSLDIRGNKLKTLPATIANVNSPIKLWISDNPYECSCDTLWMKDWLIDAENVMDKKNVTCSSNRIKGIVVYKLDQESLGCFGFPLWKIITLAVGATMVIVITIIVAKKWKSIKFHYYAHFTNDDDSQDLSQMKYDAFVSSSESQEEFVETQIVNYLEECQFKICWHRRDFEPGTQISENIEDAIVHSRRMIFVISREYAGSQWCMYEFREALAHANLNGRIKFLIPILFGDVSIEDLYADLKFYLENHTYIEHNNNNMEIIKKRLRKSMPHVHLLKLRPELSEQETDAQGTSEVTGNNDVVNCQGDVEVNVNNNTACSTDEGNATEMEANTTFHDLEAEHTGGNNGLVQRFKRFISKRKANIGNIAAGRTELLVGDEDDTMRYGDDESSESDNEGNQHDGIPLVRRNKRK